MVRITWGSLNPVTRIARPKKGKLAYSRKNFKIDSE